MKFLILVTHLHGTGHLARSLAISQTLAERGHKVVLVSGGSPISLFSIHHDVSFVQLPPVKSNGFDFSKLLDETGEEVSAEFMIERQRIILDTFHDLEPDLILTELFPFGRRSLKEEFLLLLNAAKNAKLQPAIVASVRDILEPPSSIKKRQMAEKILAEFYDGILVHGEEELISLEMSWGECRAFEEKLFYTGYVHNERCFPVAMDNEGNDEVIVTAGGGPLGHQLFDVAMACCLSGVETGRLWRFLVGGGDAERVIKTLEERAVKRSNIIVEHTRPDFPDLLKRAALSIQRAGYNSVLDLLKAKSPAVLCPYDLGQEKEQTIRALALKEHFHFPVLSGGELNLDSLTVACETALTMKNNVSYSIAMTGAERSVDFMEKILERIKG